MPLGPAELIEYFQVKYWVVADIEDSADVGDEPDQTQVNGWITFTPNLDKNAPVVKYPTALDEDDNPLGFELAPLKRRIKVVNGKLSHNDTGYVKLEANSTWANPQEWTWHVEFDLTTSSGRIPRAGFDIAAVPDSIVDLTVVSPVGGGTGVQIVQGPQGFSIDGFSIVGSNFYASLNDPLNTQLGPVPIPAVVDAANSAAAAAASQLAAAGSASAASGSASSAGGSASAAGSSAAAAAQSVVDAQAVVDSFDLTIGSVTTSAPGSSASADINGTAPVYTLDLVLPRGQEGPVGPSAPDATDAVKGILQFGGVLAGSTATSQTLAAGSVTAAMIAGNSLTAAQIAADAIGSSELADNAVDTNAIANLAVTAGKIANDTITATQIAANAIGSSELADNAVDTNAIADSAVTSAKLADGTIVNADVSTSAAIAASKTLVPASFPFIAQGGTRASGAGDLTNGIPFFDPFIVDQVIYFFGTKDASGSTTVKMQRNRAGTTVDIANSSLTISDANQVDGTATDAARTATISDPTGTGLLQAGDRLIPNLVTPGTTPGKLLGVYVKGRWA